MCKKCNRLEVQLAGCAVAALGGVEDLAKEGDHGWSPAYQDVLELREKYDRLVAAGESVMADWNKVKVAAGLVREGGKG